VVEGWNVITVIATDMHNNTGSSLAYVYAGISEKVSRGRSEGRGGGREAIAVGAGC